jgi:NitT/TauT family transport system substrate-binding protein
MKKLICLFMLLMSVQAFAKPTHNICWSHYTGWEPWAYADKAGILKKWGDKYGVNIKLRLINDYVESINLYTLNQKKDDPCVATTMTNMDALGIPAFGGVDSTALIIGDYSNGNDAIVLRNGTSVKDLKGKKIIGVELSVSEYLLSRALNMNGLSLTDVKFTHNSDADITSVFNTQPTIPAVVTWNPLLMQLTKEGTATVFDSSQIPGEILDMLVIKTNAPEELKKALVGAWYETMGVLNSKNKAVREDAVKYMAKFSESTVQDFEKQLTTTFMYYNPTRATKFTESKALKNTMNFVRKFTYDRGFFKGKPANYVGIQFPDGFVEGDKNNVKLRFTAKYMQMASDGKL